MSKYGDRVYSGAVKRCSLCASDCWPEAKVCASCQHYFTAEEDEAARRSHRNRYLLRVIAVAFLVLFVMDQVGGFEGLGAALGALERQ